MPRLERPKKGDIITAEWGQAVFDALEELKRGPAVVPPLASLGGAIYFGDNYLLRLVKTTSEISARSTTTLGTGTCDFWTNVDDAMEVEGGFVEVDVLSILGSTIPEGVYGLVAWVGERWFLVSADCSGNA